MYGHPNAQRQRTTTPEEPVTPEVNNCSLEIIAPETASPPPLKPAYTGYPPGVCGYTTRLLYKRCQGCIDEKLPECDEIRARNKVKRWEDGQ